MKRLLLLALLSNQVVFAADLAWLGTELGKIYRESLEVETQTSKQEKIRKEITASLASSVLKITVLPLEEIKKQFEAADLSFYAGAQGYLELEIKASELLPTLPESLRLQSLSIQYETELSETESKLKDIFYSSSPYRTELEALGALKLPLQENFSGALNMSEGHVLESMLTEFNQLGFRWERKVVKGQARFIFDEVYFQKFHQVSSPEFLSSKSKILSQILQGPVRKFSYLKSVHSYLSKRFGAGEFEFSLRDLIAKLK